MSETQDAEATKAAIEQTDRLDDETERLITKLEDESIFEQNRGDFTLATEIALRSRIRKIENDAYVRGYRDSATTVLRMSPKSLKLEKA